MIYLLGGSGYVGQAYQALLTQKGIPFRNLKRAEVNYADPATLTAALRADKPDFLINAAGYTGKPNVDACELHKAECLDGNAVLPGRIAEACAAALSVSRSRGPALTRCVDIDHIVDRGARTCCQVYPGAATGTDSALDHTGRAAVAIRSNAARVEQ